MNGNTPYAGSPGVVGAGQPSDPVELSPEERELLREALASIVARTESYLPEGYAVGSELSDGANGPEATVAIQPPVGHPVSAGLTPTPEDLQNGLDQEERDEVARGLAASAALQVMTALGDDITPTAR
ncbi:MAG: DUF5811 family protein [Haloferacaceae archaeon]